MRILFIGNSHTYVNDMPEIVARLAKKDGIDCEVAMIAHGGWFLEQHAAEPETRFNILYVVDFFRGFTCRQTCNQAYD